jgi:hypothetical protein
MVTDVSGQASTDVTQLKDEDAMLARISVDDALNLHNPLPTGAGPLNDSQYFIGAFKEEETMVAVGGEFFNVPGGVDEWNWCDADCLPFGVKVLDPAERFTYASFTPIPVPAAVWLFGSGLLGLVGISRRKKSA